MDAVGVEGTPFTVALVGGRRFREQCLARYLEMSGMRITIGAVEHLRESLVSQEGAIDLVVIDTGDHTCSDRSITPILACLSNVLPGAPVVVVSDREDWSAVCDALCHAVRAYFPSSLDPEILVETLRLVQRGGTFIPLEVLVNAPMHRRRLGSLEARRPETRGLTPSEQRVLELLSKGKPNKVIARELDIEETTVKVHVRRIMKKLNAANRTQAALVAQQMAGAVA
ncbi:MAG TPA: response regulator transcription factor [Nitrospira sp.]|nr:response regulator transcription factor [Nitrospira sp.]